MPEVIISGTDGRIEGRYHQSTTPNAPMALVLHPHPLYGGTMNNKVVYNVYHSFVDNGFSTLRINFRGTGKSQGKFDGGIGELTDAAAALDWLHLHNQSSSSVWIAGFSFGAWVALQLLMRRPEIAHFIAISPPVGKQDFSFISPCPISGLIVQGNRDSVVSEEKVTTFANKLKSQKSARIEYELINNADHFYRTKMPELVSVVNQYIKSKLSYKPTTKTKTDKRRKHLQAETASQ